MSGKKNKSKYKKPTSNTAPENVGDAVDNEPVSSDTPESSASVDVETNMADKNIDAAIDVDETTDNDVSLESQEDILPTDFEAETIVESDGVEAGHDIVSDATGSAETIATVATSAAAASTLSPDPKSHKQSNILAIATLILLLLLAAGAAYFAWQFWQDNNQRLQLLEGKSTEQQNQWSSADSQQAEQLATQKSALADLQTSISAQQKVLQQRIDSHAQRLRSLAGTSRDDWLLAEARYLLRLANQRLLMNGGAAGALGLLESADKILVAMDDPDLFPVRDAVAKDMVALKLAPTVDREGLYLQLAAIKSQLTQLPGVPLQRPDIQVDNNTRETTDADIAQPWYGTLWSSVKGAFGHLDRYVRVRDHNATTEPLLTDAQQQQMTYSLHLMLEQSQLALLREEEKVYRQSLAQAITWLNAHYKHYTEKDALVEEIARLQNAVIVQQLPDISRSLEMLTDYIDRYHKITPENQSQEKQQQPSLQRLPKGERKQTDTKKNQTIPQIFKKLEKKSPPVEQGEAL